MSAWEGSEWQRRREGAPAEKVPDERERLRRMQEELRREAAAEAGRRAGERLREVEARAALPASTVVSEDQKEAILREYLRTPEGCMRVADAGYVPAHDALEDVYEDREALTKLETLIVVFERVKRGLRGDETWASSRYVSRAAFDELLADMIKARDLAQSIHNLRDKVRLDAMQEILTEVLGVSPPHAPVVEDSTRR